MICRRFTKSTPFSTAITISLGHFGPYFSLRRGSDSFFLIPVYTCPRRTPSTLAHVALFSDGFGYKLSSVDLTKNLKGQVYPGIRHQCLHTDIPRAREGGMGAQFWSGE